MVYSALSIAIAADNQEAVTLLTEAGARLSLSSLAAAIQAGNNEMVQKTPDAGLDINGKILAQWGVTKWAAFQHASYQGHLGIARKLIDAGASIDAAGEICSHSDSGCTG